MMAGRPKLDAYIEYRETRLNSLLTLIQSSPKGLDREALYEAMYGSRNLEGPIRYMAYNNLD